MDNLIVLEGFLSPALGGALFLLGSFVAMLLSATVGFGGSLLMVPLMLLFFSPVKAAAIAALALGINNIGKFGIYHKNIPWKQAFPLAMITAIVGGASALFLLSIPPELALAAIAGVLVLSAIGEFIPLPKTTTRLGACVGLAIASVASGLSGTSGPTKGLALRSLQLPKNEMVATSTIVSMFGDLSKVAVFFASGLYQGNWAIATIFVLLSPFACHLGFFANRRTTEIGFRSLFWVVVAGYALRLFGELGLG